MNRRSFLKRISLFAGLGLIQPVELIKLFKPKSTTFYSLPPKTLTTDELNDIFKKIYGENIVALFNRHTTVYDQFAKTSTMPRGKGYQFAIKQA